MGNYTSKDDTTNSEEQTPIPQTRVVMTPSHITGASMESSQYPVGFEENRLGACSGNVFVMDDGIYSHLLCSLYYTIQVFVINKCNI